MEENKDIELETVKPATEIEETDELSELEAEDVAGGTNAGCANWKCSAA